MADETNVDPASVDPATSAPGNPGDQAPAQGNVSDASSSSDQSTDQSPNETPAASPDGGDVTTPPEELAGESNASSDGPEPVATYPPAEVYPPNSPAPGDAEKVGETPEVDQASKSPLPAPGPQDAPDAPPLGSLESLTNEKPLQTNPREVVNTTNSPNAPVSTEQPLGTQPVAVRVDNMSRRSDDDALEGHFVNIVSGDHKGVRGVFEWVAEYDKETGYPSKILVRSRDSANELLTVSYDDVRPAFGYLGGR